MMWQTILLILATSGTALGLRCYECRTSVTDPSNSLCLPDEIRKLTEAEKTKMIKTCELEKSRFCYVMTMNIDGVDFIDRGCSKHQDAKGRRLQTGCVSDQQKSAKVCFCSTDHCNNHMNHKSVAIARQAKTNGSNTLRPIHSPLWYLIFFPGVIYKSLTGSGKLQLDPDGSLSNRPSNESLNSQNT